MVCGIAARPISAATRPKCVCVFPMSMQKIMRRWPGAQVSSSQSDSRKKTRIRRNVLCALRYLGARHVLLRRAARGADRDLAGAKALFTVVGQSEDQRAVGLDAFRDAGD